MTDATRLTIALTGGIASGKTVVSDRLKVNGASIIDTDVVAREVVANGSPGLQAVASHFGAEFLTDTGELDRARLRALVFREPEQRAALEAITHPLIRQRCLALAASATGPYLVFVVPLLVGSSFIQLVDRVLVVDCPSHLQLQRLMARDSETTESAQRILQAQSDRRSRLAIADDVLVNDSDLDTLIRKTDALHQFYLSLAGDAKSAKREG